MTKKQQNEQIKTRYSFSGGNLSLGFSYYTLATESRSNNTTIQLQITTSNRSTKPPNPRPDNQHNQKETQSTLGGSTKRSRDSQYSLQMPNNSNNYSFTQPNERVTCVRKQAFIHTAARSHENEMLKIIKSTT